MGLFKRKKKEESLLDVVNPFAVNSFINYLDYLDEDVMISINDSETGVYLFCSQGVTHLLGYSVDELLGRNAYDLIHPDDTDRVAESHRWVLKGKDVNYLILRMRHKNGDYRIVESLGWNTDYGIIVILQPYKSNESNEIEDLMDKVISTSDNMRVKVDRMQKALEELKQKHQERINDTKLDESS